MAAQNRSFDPVPKGAWRKAVIASWSISSAPWDGEAFEGGTAQDISVDLGLRHLYPGFRGFSSSV